MKVIVAIDSLKGSLSSLEAGKAVEDGIKKAIPTAEVMIKPVADGGEGTVTALTTGLQGSLEKVAVTGPLGQKVEAAYGICLIKQQSLKWQKPPDCHWCRWINEIQWKPLLMVWEN